MLEEEFPLEENNEDMENEESEDAATERLETEIEERFVTDENNLVTLTVQTHKPIKALNQQNNDLVATPLQFLLLCYCKVVVLYLPSYVLLCAFL